MLIPRSVFGIRKIADKESSRYALGAVQFARGPDGEPIACATDGRRLVALSWHEPEQEFPPCGLDLKHNRDLNVLIPVAAIEQVEKCKLGLKSPKPVLSHVAMEEPPTDTPDDKPREVGFVATDLSQTARFSPRQVGGRFPRWRECVPSPDSDGASIAISAWQLREMLELLEKHTGDHQVIFTLASKNPHNAPLVMSAASADGRKAIGVLMPLAVDKQNSKPQVAWEINAKSVAKLPAPVATAAPADSPAAAEPEPAKPAEEPAPAAPEPAPSTPPAPAAPEPGSGFRDAGSFTPAFSVAAAGKPRAPRKPIGHPAGPPAPDWRHNAREVICAVHV